MTDSLLAKEGESIFSATDLLKTDPHDMTDEDVVFAYAFLSRFKLRVLEKRMKKLHDYLMPLCKNKGEKIDNEYVLGSEDLAVENKSRKGKIKYSLDNLKAVLDKKAKLEWWSLKQEKHNISFINQEIKETINEAGIQEALAHGLLDMDDITKFTEISEETRVLTVKAGKEFNSLFELE